MLGGMYMKIDYENLQPITIDLTGTVPVVVSIKLPEYCENLTVYLVNDRGTMVQPKYISPGLYSWTPTPSLIATATYWFEGVDVMTGNVDYKSGTFDVTAIKPASGGGGGGTGGIYSTPDVSEEGDLSWTNNGGLVNPDPVNIMGDSFVYVGSETPTDPIKTIWIDPNSN